MTLNTKKAEKDYPDASYRGLFKVKSFPQIAVGTLLSRIGAQFWLIALILFILQQYHSPVFAGFATFLAVTPGLLVSPIAGALLDRYGKLKLILLDYGIVAASLFLIALCSFLHLLSYSLLLVIVVIGSMTNPLSETGMRTLFPAVVPRELWDRANAIDSGSLALATVIGPALAGFAVANFGGTGAFIIAGGIFAITSLVVFSVQNLTTPPSTSGHLLLSAWQSVVYVVKHPTLRGVIFTLWITNIPYGILTVTVPVLALQEFHWGIAVPGELWSVAGVATIVAGILSGSIDSEGRERLMIVIGLILGAVACLLVLIQNPLTVILGIAFFGLSFGPIDIGLLALRQRKTDPTWFGRVFAVSMSLNFLGMPVGSALAGTLAEHSIVLALAFASIVAVVGCAVPFLTIPRER